MKRIPKTIILLTITVIGLIFAITGCGSESDSTSENQQATVQRGDLTIDITAVGNLALSLKEDLAFEISGTVAEVLVEEGDIVEEGQILATLDTSEWEDELAVLEDQVTLAERNVIAKERAVTAAKRGVITEKLALLQAQKNLQAAEDSLDEVEQIAKLKTNIENAEFDLRVAQVMVTRATTLEDKNIWLYEINSLQQYIAEAEEELAEILAGNSAILTADEALTVEMKKLEVELAEWDLQDAEKGIEDAEKGIEDAEKELADANEAVQDAREALDEALNTGPEIIAPFAGFVTRVNVKGGDEVKKGTVAVVIADPDKFEADILVSEMDIFQVELGGEASVEVDALSGVSLPAQVTHISPTATIQSGVVNYTVRVEITSLEAVAMERQEAMEQARQKMAEDIASGEIPERFQQAIDQGLMTEEQVEEMMERMKQMQEEGGMPFPPGGGEGGMPFPPGGGEGGMPFPPGGGEGEMNFPSGGGQMTVVSIEDFQLKEGLTVTVSIIVSESTDVLLIPNSAITYQGMQAYVEVVTAEGVTEQRAIQTGLTDYQYTEVVSGLSEGEQVIVPEGTTTTTTQPGPPGGIMIPGIGGPRR